MFDMRYHIASLVAVFLALTIGLLLGSLVAEKGVLTKQQERLVESIKSDVDRINQENLELQSGLKELQDFQAQVLPLTVKDRLADFKVLTVTMSEGQADVVNGIEGILKSAGAAGSSAEIKVNRLNFSNGKLVERLGAKFGVTGSKGGDFERLFWERLAAELVGSEPHALVDELAARGLISLDAQQLPFTNITVVAPAGKKAGNRDVLFLEALVKTGKARVVGAETTQAEPSRIPVYKLRNVSTVDNIEAIPGKIALVYLLADPQLNAHFGTKSTADKLLP